MREFLIIILFTIISIVSASYYKKNNNSKNEKISIPEIQVIETNLLFNIPVDSFLMEKKRIKYNEYLGNILNKLIPDQETNREIIQEISEVFDITKFKARNYYYLFYSKDSTRTLKHFVYEHSLAEYIKVSFNDTVRVERKLKEVQMIQKFAEGVIEKSLWETMLDNDINPALAIELSDIYAWTVDFFGLQKGDCFKVIYNEQYIDSISIGPGMIYAAVFSHKGNDYKAFHFITKEQTGYFDENGNSLKKAFLKAPLRFRRISSGFSYRRFHPILKYYRPHRGVDYVAPVGTPVYTIGDGKVIAKGYTKAAGYYLKIRHNSVYTSGYNHLSGYARNMYVGKELKQGELIGFVGRTGYSTGPHLDFRIWQNGHLTNPLRIKAPPIEPIDEKYMSQFNRVKKLYLTLLYNI
ncbi:peptidoglycan DD-metalloendopeptidase family protein [Bacteroidota bacterium]